MQDISSFLDLDTTRKSSDAVAFIVRSWSLCSAIGFYLLCYTAVRRGALRGGGRVYPPVLSAQLLDFTETGREEPTQMITQIPRLWTPQIGLGHYGTQRVHLSNWSGKYYPTFATSCTHYKCQNWLPRTVPFKNQTLKYVVGLCQAFLYLDNNGFRLKGGYHTYIWRNWNDEGAVRQVSFCPKRRAVLVARTAFYTFHPSRPTRSSVVWF